uniref:Uncharacterized protein n=1 Tax=Chromera velia CCMP2878 TaxID=1169474 RepID=A0A0G4HFC6_9ALVE|eukprot:Cvel_26973.t1-p1 / transcript=Cvel_26973.t1 / gene=Cvel_26973 / organism=Chromera_velia_CCMP2878 / gene_product=hypothetical protein / transcript_product=hypothetical protein / location=Cvel_scaffold3291:456-11265(+) / protein_length=1976 / sequence_SO=supercontig / SO=protein_coding / is_pseudo=false
MLGNPYLDSHAGLAQKRLPKLQRSSVRLSGSRSKLPPIHEGTPLPAASSSGRQSCQLPSSHWKPAGVLGLQKSFSESVLGRERDTEGGGHHGEREGSGWFAREKEERLELLEKGAARRRLLGLFGRMMTLQDACVRSLLSRHRAHEALQVLSRTVEASLALPPELATHPIVTLSRVKARLNAAVVLLGFCRVGCGGEGGEEEEATVPPRRCLHLLVLAAVDLRLLLLPPSCGETKQSGEADEVDTQGKGERGRKWMGGCYRDAGPSWLGEAVALSAALVFPTLAAERALRAQGKEAEEKEKEKDPQTQKDKTNFESIRSLLKDLSSLRPFLASPSSHWLTRLFSRCSAALKNQKVSRTASEEFEWLRGGDAEGHRASSLIPVLPCTQATRPLHIAHVGQKRHDIAEKNRQGPKQAHAPTSSTDVSQQSKKKKKKKKNTNEDSTEVKRKTPQSKAKNTFDSTINQSPSSSASILLRPPQGRVLPPLGESAAPSSNSVPGPSTKQGPLPGSINKNGPAVFLKVAESLLPPADPAGNAHEDAKDTLNQADGQMEGKGERREETDSGNEEDKEGEAEETGDKETSFSSFVDCLIRISTSGQRSPEPSTATGVASSVTDVVETVTAGLLETFSASLSPPRGDRSGSVSVSGPVWVSGGTERETARTEMEVQAQVVDQERATELGDLKTGTTRLSESPAAMLPGEQTESLCERSLSSASSGKEQEEVEGQQETQEAKHKSEEERENRRERRASHIPSVRFQGGNLCDHLIGFVSQSLRAHPLPLPLRLPSSEEAREGGEKSSSSSSSSREPVCFPALPEKEKEEKARTPPSLSVSAPLIALQFPSLFGFFSPPSQYGQMSVDGHEKTEGGHGGKRRGSEEEEEVGMSSLEETETEGEGSDETEDSSRGEEEEEGGETTCGQERDNKAGRDRNKKAVQEKMRRGIKKDAQGETNKTSTSCLENLEGEEEEERFWAAAFQEEEEKTTEEEEKRYGHGHEREVDDDVVEAPVNAEPSLSFSVSDFEKSPNLGAAAVERRGESRVERIIKTLTVQEEEEEKCRTTERTLSETRGKGLDEVLASLVPLLNHSTVNDLEEEEKGQLGEHDRERANLHTPLSAALINTVVLSLERIKGKEAAEALQRNSKFSFEFIPALKNQMMRRLKEVSDLGGEREEEGVGGEMDDNNQEDDQKDGGWDIFGQETEEKKEGEEAPWEDSKEKESEAWGIFGAETEEKKEKEETERKKEEEETKEKESGGWGIFGEEAQETDEKKDKPEATALEDGKQNEEEKEQEDSKDDEGGHWGIFGNEGGDMEDDGEDSKKQGGEEENEGGDCWADDDDAEETNKQKEKEKEEASADKEKADESPDTLFAAFGRLQSPSETTKQNENKKEAPDQKVKGRARRLLRGSEDSSALSEENMNRKSNEGGEEEEKEEYEDEGWEKESPESDLKKQQQQHQTQKQGARLDSQTTEMMTASLKERARLLWSKVRDMVNNDPNFVFKALGNALTKRTDENFGDRHGGKEGKGSGKEQGGHSGKEDGDGDGQSPFRGAGRSRHRRRRKKKKKKNRSKSVYEAVTAASADERAAYMRLVMDDWFLDNVLLPQFRRQVRTENVREKLAPHPHADNIPRSGKEMTQHDFITLCTPGNALTLKRARYWISKSIRQRKETGVAGGARMEGTFSSAEFSLFESNRFIDWEKYCQEKAVAEKVGRAGKYDDETIWKQLTIRVRDFERLLLDCWRRLDRVTQGYATAAARGGAAASSQQRDSKAPVPGRRTTLWLQHLGGENSPKHIQGGASSARGGPSSSSPGVGVGKRASISTALTMMTGAVLKDAAKNPTSAKGGQAAGVGLSNDVLPAGGRGAPQGGMKGPQQAGGGANALTKFLRIGGDGGRRLSVTTKRERMGTGAPFIVQDRRGDDFLSNLMGETAQGMLTGAFGKGLSTPRRQTTLAGGLSPQLGGGKLHHSPSHQRFFPPSNSQSALAGPR